MSGSSKKSNIQEKDIVVLTTPMKKVGSWSFGHRPGTVAEVTLLREHAISKETMYQIRFLSNYVGCASILWSHELKPASATTRRKYDQKYIRKLFGRCLKKGCSDTCKHGRN